MNKKAQLTIVVIVGIIIVAGVAAFFAIRGGFFFGEIPAEFQPVFRAYEECVREETTKALDLAGTQGGRVDVGSVERGSSYAPFSSQLNFLDIDVPYWFYMAGNGIIKEQVPTKKEIENDIAKFLDERLRGCDFDEYYSQGFYIEMGEPRASVLIENNKINAEVKMLLSVQKGETTAQKNTHAVEVSSRFGEMYETAVKVYEKQRDRMFLEDYAIDVLRLYAPVDGIEISCAPKIWKTREVVENIEKGLEANIGALKMKGDYYNLNKKENKYFEIDAGEDVKLPVRFLYSPSWPTKIEITSANEELMIAEPMGKQEGMGLLGFCYVPYHFVYDVLFPVMVQVGDGLELFQFPVAVIIDNNVPREVKLGSLGDILGKETFELCSFAGGDVEVRTYDTNLNPVEANISYQCFDQLCKLGETKISSNGAVLNAKIPVCVNGYLVIDSKGYGQKKQLFSSNRENSADIILEREYEVDANVLVNGKELGEGASAIVHFSSEDNVASAMIPENKRVVLKEGSYDVEVFVYGNSSIVIPASRKTQCYETSRGGLLGLVGMTREECVDIEIPETKIEYALLGGGKTTTYILESDLEKGKITLSVPSISVPTSLEELQYNFELFDSLNIGVMYE